MPREIADDPAYMPAPISPAPAPAAVLNAIATEGAALEGGEGLAHDASIAKASPAPASSADQDQAATWALIPATLGSVLAMAMPELKDVYTPDACAAWGAAMLPVAKKYGWTIGPDSPELALLAASVPFAIGTYGAIAKRKAPSSSRPSSSPASSPARPRNVYDIASQAAPTGTPPDLSQPHA